MPKTAAAVPETAAKVPGTAAAVPRPRAKPAAAPTGTPSAKPADARAPRDDEAIPEPPRMVQPPEPFGPPPLQAPMPDMSLGEPAPLPEPAKLPKPGPVPAPQGPSETPGQGMDRVPPANAPIGASQDGTREVPTAPPAGLDRSSEADAAGSGEELINPGASTAEGAPASPAQPRDGAAIAPRTPANRIPATRTPASRTPVVPARPSDLDTADRLFRKGKYDEAGRIYAAMAARNALAADRRPHWAYCRYTAVVNRINARPRSGREWDDIEAEIRIIQRLAPGIWFGDYLMNKVSEARRSGRKRPAAADSVVVRGSAPDEPSPQLQPQDQAPPPAQAQAPARRRLFGRSRGTSTPAAPLASPADGQPASPDPDRPLVLPGSLPRPDATTGAGPGSDTDATSTPGDEPRAGSPAAPEGDAPRSRVEDSRSAPGGAEPSDTAPTAWQVHETANFRIYHCDPTLAERAAAVAEAVRTAQARRWGSTTARAAWSPRCELYLYPTARGYAEATGQPEMSPGISTMSTNGVRVLSRRMNLRVDNPLMLTTTLPHEVTHIVLADLFVVHTIPRWADEGLAVLAEPATEQHLRQADLKGPLDAGRVFKVGQLMTMDYPDPKDWRLFYAQSVSLTVFLVEQGPPERFIQFVRDSQRKGAEAALRDIYHIDSLGALHGAGWPTPASTSTSTWPRAATRRRHSRASAASDRRGENLR